MKKKDSFGNQKRPHCSTGLGEAPFFHPCCCGQVGGELSEETDNLESKVLI